MKLRSPHLWIAIFSALAVFSVALVDLERTSPGPLASVHHFDPELDEGNNCSSCHGGWSVSMTDACLECHATIGEDIEHRRGLHGTIGTDEDGRFDRRQAEQCAACHSDHHGTTAALVNARSFALAGVPERDSFDHRRIGFAMEGAHLELACSECHEHADEPILPRGEERFRGLDQRCLSCHREAFDEAHPEGMRPSCTACHGQENFTERVSTDHGRHLPLVGGHAGVGCADCHEEGTSHSLQALGQVLGPKGRGAPNPRACRDCHDSPHAGEFVAGAAEHFERLPKKSCVECHVAEHESFREPGLEISAELHALSGFLLDAPHDGAGCADCHDPELEAFAARFPGRSQEGCSVCHEDPHGGQFASGPFAGQECTACHDTHQFEEHAFTAREHELTSLPLTGTHLDVECSACHQVPNEGEPRRFQGVSNTCADCHDDAHLGFFDGHAAVLEPVAHGDCARCHDTDAFAAILPAEAGGFRHGPWTDFEIRGAHGQAGCVICHTRSEEPDETGRRFGRVSELFGEFQGCSTCHTDPHRGKFDGPRRPAEVEGRTGCMRCHVETSFRAFPEGFDHQLWTGVPLRGAHGKIDCVACHEPTLEADDFGLFWGAARGRKCQDCHADPHAGQFELVPENASGIGRGGGEARTDCRRCHTTVSFDETSFNHETDSRFPLGEPHQGLACEACHESWDLESGGELVRYRPLGTACVDCHGVPEDQLKRRTRRKR